MNPIKILTLLLLLGACGGRGDHSHDHDHDHHHHDDVKLFLWGYSESFEVFAEADPFATDDHSVILAHITRLDDFSPLASGRVTASLISGNRGIRQTLEMPERPGVYRFVMQPETTGEARMVIAIEAGGLDEQVHLGPLMVHDDAHYALHAAEEVIEEIPGAIVFTKEQSWVVDFATGEAVQQVFGPVIRTVGHVMPERGDETILTARTSGVVAFGGKALYAGLQVNARQPLLNVHGGALAEGNAALRFIEARNNYERARADYERLQELNRERIASDRDLLAARNEYENAAALFENLRQHFTETGQVVISPWSGYLKDIFVSEGEYVEAGRPLLSLARNRNMVVRADVQQQFAALLQNVTQANIGISGQLPVPLSEMQGRVISVGKSLDAATNMIAVHIQLSNAERLVPGSLVTVYLKTETDREVLVIPATALVEEQGNFFVFVQNHPESFSKRQIATGHSDGLLTEVTAGLYPGERIVTRGAVMVRLAAASGNLDPHAGHIH